MLTLLLIDAEIAVREFDGKRMEGDRIVVEYAKRGPLSVRTRGGMRDRCYNCGESGHM
ncbi:hypothetical protein BCR43DRAFT_482104 [Syncephalastrum racemosum]|uniref:CCHC-type domain-containing protein n=1 Tax=Syncephalastrum racemosum TaxID=13706 RepID=A0A1X2HT95_SYNRA|nr:hypothetical protein BCR43DRAFT_482104 [Syncephalastrum racemosum]